MDLGTGENDVAARALYESLGFDNRGAVGVAGGAGVARCSAAAGPIRPLAAGGG